MWFNLGMTHDTQQKELPVATTFANTAEQDNALRLFATGEDLVIQAGAGTGKTTTLRLLAESTPRRGQYIAFNKEIVLESRLKMPRTINCSTAHSLAYRAIGTPYESRMRSGKRMKSIDIANTLKIDGLQVRTWDGQTKSLSRSFLAGLTLKAINRFCTTADPEPTFRHVPRIEGLDAPGADWSNSPVNREVAKRLVPALNKAWADLTRTDGQLPFTLSTAMSVILKLWQLSSPRIGADYILFDEAQDANPVMVAIVAAQKHAQLVWVGDSQQQIYSFTGAINALDNLPDANVGFLTQSFRFGPAIADVANSVLENLPSAKLRLVGTPSIASLVCPVADPDCVLTRTNAEAFRTVLRELNDGRKVHLVGGGQEVVGFAKAAERLQNGEKTDHPELACFDTWGEVQDYVAQDEQGGDLRLMVNLIDEFGVAKILEALSTDTRAEDADVTVSTAHKAKGKEWDRVALAGDFPDDPKGEEWRLLYVAVTRAKNELDITMVPAVQAGYTPSAHSVTATTAALAAPPVLAPKVQAEDDTPAVTVMENGHVGQVGERLALTLKVERSTVTRNNSWFTILSSKTGNAFKWFADDHYEVGTELAGVWVVREHGDFNGTKQTVLGHAVHVEVAA